MVELASSGSIGSVIATVLLLVALVAIFTLFDRWSTVGALGIVYLAAFLLMRSMMTPGPIIFIQLLTGFFVMVILGMTLRQLGELSSYSKGNQTRPTDLSLPLRLITALVALVFVWVVAQIVTPLPPLPNPLVLPVFAFCGLGLWLAIVARAWFRSGIGLLLFFNGLLLLVGSTQSSAMVLGAVASLQLLIAVGVGFALLRGGVADRVGELAGSADI